MNAALWHPDATLSDAQYRCLVAVDAWNRTHPGRRPTISQVAELCGWDHHGEKARRILRELEGLGRIDRGTSEQGGGARVEITIAARAAVSCVDATGDDANPCEIERSEDMHAGAIACDSERIDIDPFTDATPTISADGLLREVMALLGMVASGAPTLDLAKLEAYASRLDLLLGFTPGESLGRNYTALNRRKFYLRLFEAIANGIGLALVGEKLKASLSRFLRRYAVSRADFDRPYFYRVMHESGIEPTTWTARRRRGAARSESVRFRPILPDMNRYAVPSHNLIRGI